jgi:hypothetical protein
MIKLKRNECLKKYPNFPRTNYYHNKFFYPDSVASYLLTVDSRFPERHINSLGKELIKFIDYLSIKDLIFLGDSSIEWLFQNNDFNKIQKAFTYLRENKIGKTFNGGLIVNMAELPLFFKHLFWLGRCNSAFPLVYFMDHEQSFVANICKYGNLHLSLLNADLENPVNIFLTQNPSLFKIDECFQVFSTNKRIKGRQAIVP